jgi:hypothetical protein
MKFLKVSIFAILFAASSAFAGYSVEIVEMTNAQLGLHARMVQKELELRSSGKKFYAHVYIEKGGGYGPDCAAMGTNCELSLELINLETGGRVNVVEGLYRDDKDAESTVKSLEDLYRLPLNKNDGKKYLIADQAVQKYIFIDADGGVSLISADSAQKLQKVEMASSRNGSVKVYSIISEKK